MLRFDRVRKALGGRQVIRDVDLLVEEGRTTVLIGPSGCGKSTVTRAVLQLLPRGSICEGGLELTGRDPRRLSGAELRKLRGEAAGLVFQDPMTRLNRLMTVGAHLADTVSAHRPEWSARASREITCPTRSSIAVAC